MTMKSWMDAQRYKGGPLKYLYDVVKSIMDNESDMGSDVEALQNLIGDPDAEEPAEGTILARIKALEDA